MEPGTLVGGRFEILEEVGRGGMATVFRADDRHTGAVVALKVVAATDAEGAARFAREIRLLSELHHAGIVRYVAHDASEGGAAYLVMEWLEGEDLEKRLKRGPLSQAESVSLGIRVGEALGVAHAREVVHRDVKPSNVFVPGGDVERAKVLDFGVARGGSMAVTRTGALVGTVAYMAPEQVRGEKITPATDVFALGCVLFECLTGQQVFDGDNMFAIVAKIALSETPRARDLTPEVAPELDDLVARMMAKRPEDRPKDGEAVASELRALPPLSVRAPGARVRATSIPPPGLGGAEQRLVSVIVAKVDGAAYALDATLLADDDAGAQARARVDETAREHDGRLTRLADGSAIVVLTGAKSATDLAARAARCALALKAALSGCDVAVATGRGVVSADTPASAVIDVATRLLEGTALPARDVVWLDDATYGLLDARFDLGGDERRLFVRGARDGAADETRRLLGRPTTCVGRDRELAALTGLAAEAVSESVARVALVTGPVGVGKSRLRYELVRRLLADPPDGKEIEVWIARGDPVRAGSSFGLLAPAVRRVASVQEGEPLLAQRSKLRARVARTVGGESLDRITEFLGELVGVPFADEGSVQLRAARHEPLLMGDQMRRAWEDWLAGELEHHAVLLVIEDLHWGDLPSVQFVDAALRRHHDKPLMVLALARPEVTNVFPQLWQGRAVTVMRLDGLSRKASERLVREVLGDRAEGPELARILDRAGGNAFYLEELIRAVAGGRAELPETVLAMAQARLEGLPADTRRLLRAASVFGTVFWGSALAKLLGTRSRETQNLSEQLAALETDELVERRPRAAFPGETEYAFRHALLREAAYGALTDEDRVLGHRLAGEWLEPMGETQAVVVAEHFDRGGDPARAVRWYRRAAEQALGGNDFGAVIARVEEALRCGAEGEERGALRSLEAEAQRWDGRYRESEAAGLEALGLLPRASAAWYAAAGEVVTASSLRANRDGLLAVAKEIEPIEPGPDALAAAVVAWSRAATWLLLFAAENEAARLFARIDETAPRVAHDPSVSARVLYARSAKAQCSGDPFGYRLLSEASARAFEEAGNLRSACVQWQNVGNAHIRTGALSDAVRVLGQALRSAERMGLHTETVKLWLGTACALLGDREEGERLMHESVEAARAIGARRIEAKALVELARIALAKGDLARAESLARRATERAVAPASVLSAAIVAEILLARGRVLEAREAADRAIAGLDGQVLDENDAWVRLVHAEARAACGELSAAREALHALAVTIEARAARAPDADARRRYLEDVPEHARAFARLAEWDAA